MKSALKAQEPQDPQNPQKPQNEKRRSSSNLKFAFPLKILVIEAKGEYYKTIWCAIGLGLANVMIGAVNMAAFVFSTKTGDWHALICSLAFHFFSAQAILSLNYANGWSTPLRLRHRRLVHMLLQICGMLFAVAGTTIKLITDGPPHSAHGITGVIAATVGCCNLLFGVFATLHWRYWRLFHMAFGIPTFAMATISIGCGFFTTAFKQWANVATIVVLIIFIVFYTIFIITTVFIKFLSKL